MKNDKDQKTRTRISPRIILLLLTLLVVVPAVFAQTSNETTIQQPNAYNQFSATAMGISSSINNTGLPLTMSGMKWSSTKLLDLTRSLASNQYGGLIIIGIIIGGIWFASKETTGKIMRTIIIILLVVFTLTLLKIYS